MKIARINGASAAVVTPTRPPAGGPAQSPQDSSKLPPEPAQQADAKAQPPILARKPPAKRGPRKAAADLKTELIGANCTAAECELIASAAKMLGLKPGRYLVDCALRKTAEIIASHNLYVETRMEQILEKSRRRGPEVKD